MAVQYTSVRYQDQQTGRVLGQSQLPAGWLYQGKVQNVSQSASRPFLVFLNARSQDGIDQFMADTGECFVQINRMPMGAHQEGGFNQQLGTPMRRFQTPEQYLDLQVSTMFRGNQITLVQTLPLADMRDPNTERQRILAMAEQEARMSGAGVHNDDAFWGGCARIYRVTLQNNTVITVAMSALLKGISWSQSPMGGLGAFGMLGSMDLKKPFGKEYHTGIKPFDFFMNGGLLGKMQRDREAKQAQQQAQSPVGYGFGQDFPKMATISMVNWESVYRTTFIHAGEMTDEAWGTYIRFNRTLQFDPGILAEMERSGSQYMNNQMQAQQAQFQAFQQMNQAQQAAFDSYNQAWWDRSNAEHAANRSRYQAQQASEDRWSRQWSEATRGVNTYERPDGTEVEYSVNAERVFMNNNDPTQVRSAGFGEEVPWGWTELHRKD